MRVALAVAGSEIALAIENDGRVRTISQVVGADRGACVERILRDVPRHRWSSATIVIGIGAPFVQRRRIEGLPPAKNDAVRGELVRANPTTFFLAREGGLLLAPLYNEGDATYGVAFDADVVAGNLSAARSTGLRVRAIVPLDRGVDAAAAASSLLALSPVPPLALRPQRDESRRRYRRIAVRSGAALLICVAALAAIAPTARALLDRDDIVAASSDRAILAEYDSLRARSTQIDAAIMAHASESAQRIDALRILSTVAYEAPDSTAILSFRLDSIEGSIVALTPKASDLVAALVHSTDLTNVRLSGSITKDRLGASTLDRVTLRFRRKSVQPTRRRV